MKYAVVFDGKLSEQKTYVNRNFSSKLNKGLKLRGVTTKQEIDKFRCEVHLLIFKYTSKGKRVYRMVQFELNGIHYIIDGLGKMKHFALNADNVFESYQLNDNSLMIFDETFLDSYN